MTKSFEKPRNELVNQVQIGNLIILLVSLSVWILIYMMLRFGLFSISWQHWPFWIDVGSLRAGIIHLVSTFVSNFLKKVTFLTP